MHPGSGCSVFSLMHIRHLWHCFHLLFGLLPLKSNWTKNSNLTIVFSSSHLLKLSPAEWFLSNTASGWYNASSADNFYSSSLTAWWVVRPVGQLFTITETNMRYCRACVIVVCLASTRTFTGGVELLLVDFWLVCLCLQHAIGEAVASDAVKWLQCLVKSSLLW